jgi:hypothetical protein
MIKFLFALTVIPLVVFPLATDRLAFAQPYLQTEVTPPTKSVQELRDHFRFMSLPPSRMPADAANLDRMLVSGEYLALTKRLREAESIDEIERDLSWEDHKIYDGGGFYVAFAYAYDAWRLGEARKDVVGAIHKQRAGLAFLYAYDLIVVDGPKCADVSAPGHRFDQLMMQNAGILAFLKAQSQTVRYNFGSVSVDLEKATSELRQPDKVLCSGGLAQMSESLRAQHDKSLPTVPGNVGKTVLVPGSADFKPQFLDASVWQSKQAEARSKLPTLLTSFLQGPVVPSAGSHYSEPNVCPTPYPQISVRLNEQGQTVVAVSVGADHRVSACRVVRTSGYIRLDEATCRSLQCRAEAALQSGKPWQPGEESKSVTWGLRDPSR